MIMAEKKYIKTTIYIPVELNETLKCVNKSKLITKNLTQWVKKNSKLLNALILFVILCACVSPAISDEVYNYTAGSSITYNDTFIPFSWWILSFVIGFALLIVGYILVLYILELFATLFLWACAYSAPLVGFMDTATVLTDSTNMTYTTITSVNMALQPFVSYICYGAGAVAFFLFTILLVSFILDAMQEKKQKEFNNSIIEEDGSGWY